MNKIDRSHHQLESELRQTRLRAESEAAGASHLKSDLEVALAERITLQKQIGLLSRKNEDLAGENGALRPCRRRSFIDLKTSELGMGNRLKFVGPGEGPRKM